MEENSMVDFKALEKELQAALAADEKYKRENAAKFRAVAQRVPSYEDFRGIVLASHLKPLERKDKMSGKRTAPWNCHATRRKTFQEDVAVEVSEEETPFQPGTSAEFYRDWRRRLRSGPERYQALLRLGGPTLGRLFQTDVGFGLLGELLATLANHMRPADRAAVLGILRGLAGTGRFSLNLSLLSPSELECCRALFEKLQAMGAPGAGAGQEALSGEQRGAEQEQDLLQELRELYQLR
ncbi:PREDICTED: coiled-coil domain-containing protein 103 isoform X2 [Chinchilla lanigera]|uniref:Coiled-coil domain containing 103 n=2 Tax=Chinchilla lanigera TaxID=34839 RepID=A0A8C2W1S9_CHILA|nr:PREDICTED: coiled-coil domain-containing protein 103 isoform X2 [Chinchilla lanigera]XP_013374828.1 PREDICTED: coiled-coil domain-containing protein 103 isoform X2 [Chinchilla lanigera]XP_013374829.1 PREDICTED: coiled-coil domain-containing protein 103 isoform X2 [Chinchilla lanigera]